ncbi:Uncharacterised protein [Serratia marcescens]|nr:Uncharacterised protein [Serratia marcescens]CAI0869281.1 Uncharacterised protein [Serratia marcescens]
MHFPRFDFRRSESGVTVLISKWGLTQQRPYQYLNIKKARHLRCLAFLFTLASAKKNDREQNGTVQINSGLQSRRNKGTTGLCAHFKLPTNGNWNRRRNAKVTVDRNGKTNLVVCRVITGPNTNRKFKRQHALLLKVYRYRRRCFLRKSNRSKISNMFILSMRILFIAFTISHWNILVSFFRY